VITLHDIGAVGNAFMNLYLFGAVCLTLFLQPEEARWLLSVLRLV